MCLNFTESKRYCKYCKSEIIQQDNPEDFHLECHFQIELFNRKQWTYDFENKLFGFEELRKFLENKMNFLLNEFFDKHIYWDMICINEMHNHKFNYSLPDCNILIYMDLKYIYYISCQFKLKQRNLTEL